jgi:hypothetical protein
MHCFTCGRCASREGGSLSPATGADRISIGAAQKTNFSDELFQLCFTAGAGRVHAGTSLSQASGRATCTKVDSENLKAFAREQSFH